MPLQSVNLCDQVAAHLGKLIIQGELKPGARLPENEWAKTLSVSTNSLREAFHLMEKRHLIEWRPRRGASVCQITSEDVTELYDFLFLLLARLAGRAANNWQPGQIEDLVAMLPQLHAYYERNDIASAHQLAFSFVNKAVVRFADNRYLSNGIVDLLPLLERFSYMALQEETTEFGESLKSFQQLMENVLARHADKASEDIRHYGDNQCRIVLRALAKQQADGN